MEPAAIKAPLIKALLQQSFIITILFVIEKFSPISLFSLISLVACSILSACWWSPTNKVYVLPTFEYAFSLVEISTSTLNVFHNSFLIFSAVGCVSVFILISNCDFLLLYGFNGNKLQF